MRKRPSVSTATSASSPSTIWISRTHPYGARFKALFGSDVGHWDVPDGCEVLPEAHELVDSGRISTDDFREFVFGNPMDLWAGANPRFFEGTRVEDAATRWLADR